MRKTRAKKRPLLPDPKFNDPLVTRFVNNLMFDGKKSTSYSIFYDAIDIISEKAEEANGLEQWKTALTNVMPHVEVRSRRVGGSTFQIPQQKHQKTLKLLLYVISDWFICSLEFWGRSLVRLFRSV